MSDLGSLFIVAAPSGAGKTSLVDSLIAKVPGVVKSISHTTRPRKPKEVHAEHYFFVDQEEFDSLYMQGHFVETAKIFGHSYGTAADVITNYLTAGLDVMLDIDWQGARKIKAAGFEVCSIYLLPPSKATLQARLISRGREGDAEVATRMQDLPAQLQHSTEFDYLIVNDDYEQALLELTSIVSANRLLVRKQANKITELHKSLLA